MAGEITGEIGNELKNKIEKHGCGLRNVGTCKDAPVSDRKTVGGETLIIFE